MENELYILWTSDNIITAEKMVFMYATHAKNQKWWDKITIIIWGASAQLAEKNQHIQQLIKQAIAAGVNVTACQACADQLGSTKHLESLGIEMIYWGEPFTKLLKEGKKVISV